MAPSDGSTRRELREVRREWLVGVPYCDDWLDFCSPCPLDAVGDVVVDRCVFICVCFVLLLLLLGVLALLFGVLAPPLASWSDRLAGDFTEMEFERPAE